MPKAADYTKFFSVYLRQTVPETQIEATLDCVFHDCQKEKHLHANITDGTWHCKRCDRGGNARTLITEIHKQYLDTTTIEQYAFLSRVRGLSVGVLKGAGFAYDHDADRWLVPYYTYEPDEEDFSPFLNNLGYFYPSSADPSHQFVIKKAPTLPTYLYNPGLHEYYPASTNAIICEGEWDVLAYYDMDVETRDMILGKSGSGFPIVALSVVKKCKNITLITDNDESGLKQLARAIGILKEHRKDVHIRHADWSLIDKDKWRHPISHKFAKDVRDLHTHPVHSADALAELNDSIIDYDSASSPEVTAAGYVKDATTFTPITSFGKYMDYMREINLYGDTTVKAIAAVHAVNLSITIPGKPIYIFVKGPGSSGKTEYLESFGGDNQWFESVSKLSAEMIISGWVDDNPESASYISNMIGKNVIVKDFTPNLTGPVEERTKLFGLLTDIHDGRIKIIYGNRRREEYNNTNFNLICGVTDILDAHSSASIGERFLRVDWLGSEYSSREYMKASMRNFGKDEENKQRLTELSLGFTKYIREQPIELDIPEAYEDVLCDLADFVATVRTKVETNRFEGILYRPRPEMPMRVGKQLIKLFTGGKVVYNSYEQAFEMVRKVAFDTVAGFPMDVIKFILHNPKCSREEIAEGIAVHSQRCYRVLSDLAITGVIRPQTIPVLRSNGRPKHYYIINPKLLPALQPSKYFDPDENKDNNGRRLDANDSGVRPRGPTTPKRPTPIPK